MATKQKGDNIDILDTLFSLKKKLGNKLLSDKLNELNLLHGDYDEESIKKLVIQEVCEVVGVTQEYLLDKKLYTSDDKKKNAITFVSTILFDYFDFELDQIGIIFNMERSNISKRKNYLKSLDRANRIDVLTTSIYDKVIENLEKKNIIPIKK